MFELFNFPVTVFLFCLHSIFIKRNITHEKWKTILDIIITSNEKDLSLNFKQDEADETGNYNWCHLTYLIKLVIFCLINSSKVFREKNRLMNVDIYSYPCLIYQGRLSIVYTITARRSARDVGVTTGLLRWLLRHSRYDTLKNPQCSMMMSTENR